MCLRHQTTQKDPRLESPLRAWRGGAMEKDWPKRASDRQLQEARKKDFDRAITPAAEAVRVPEHFAPPGFLQAEQLHRLHAQLSLGQSCHRQKKKKKILGLCAQGRFSPTLCNPVDWPARLLCQGRGCSRQEYWSVLVNTGRHTLLEHCISWCPSRQPPWVPRGVRTPATQAAAPPPHLASQGQTQALQGSLRSKPQWTTTCRGGNKTTAETQGQCD